MSQKAQSTYKLNPSLPRLLRYGYGGQDRKDGIAVSGQNERFAGLAQPSIGCVAKKQAIPPSQPLQSNDVEFQFSNTDVYSYLKKY